MEARIYLKLKSPRRKDSADGVELLKAGVDPGKVRRHLVRHAPALCPKFGALGTDAERDESEKRPLSGDSEAHVLSEVFDFVKDFGILKDNGR